MSDTPMTNEELHIQLEELKRQVADLERHNAQLREAIAALLEPYSVKATCKVDLTPRPQNVTSTG